jgi:hypothetical protein
MPEKVTNQTASLYSEYQRQQVEYKALLEKKRAESKEVRVRQAEAKKRIPEVQPIFKQGTRIVDDFGNMPPRMTYRGFGGSDVGYLTPPVTLEVGDERVDFVIAGITWRSNHRELALPLAGKDYYLSVSIYIVEEGGDFDPFSSQPLFDIKSEGMLSSPGREVNDPNSIQAARELMDIINKGLLETHVPRSQLPKAEPPPKGIMGKLTTIFQRRQ